MTISVYADSEQAITNWLKANTTIRNAVKVVSGRPGIFLGGAPKIPNDPDNAKLKNSLPILVLYRAGGNPDNTSDASIDYPRISFSCYSGNRAGAWNLANTLVQECMSITGGTVLDSSAVCGGASVLSVVWLPDPVLDLACFRVDISFTVLAS